MLLVVMLLLAVLVPSGSPARTGMLFGATDPRLTVLSEAPPFSAVGRLQKADGSYCTATLISDRHVLTAAHCLVAERDAELRATRLEELSGVRFLPNFREGASPEGSARRLAAIVAHGTMDLHPRSDDWAIAELEAAVDAGRFPAMALASEAQLAAAEDPDAELGGGRLHHIGYAALHPSGGASPVLVSGCSARRLITQAAVDTADRNRRASWQDRVSMIAHDCSATAGQSGGPLFLLRAGRALLVGIHTLEDVPKEHVSTRDETPIRQERFDFVYMNYAVSVVQFGAAARQHAVAPATVQAPAGWATVKAARRPPDAR